VSVKRTVHGTWQVRWRDHTGRQHSRSLRTKELAEQFHRQVRTDTDRGIPTSRPSKLTVAEFADQWLAGAHNLREGGRSLYRRDLDRHILPALGIVRVDRLTPADIDRFLADEAEAGVAASSRHRHWRTLRAMLNVAEDRDLIGRSPMRKVRPPRVPRTEMRFLDANGLEQLATAAVLRDKNGITMHSYQALVLVAGWGGLRWSEIVGLQARHTRT
jgi:site-specific recombinase XerD